MTIAEPLKGRCPYTKRGSKSTRRESRLRERALLVAYKAGDEKASAQLYRLHEPSIVAVAKKFWEDDHRRLPWAEVLGATRAEFVEVLNDFDLSWPNGINAYFRSRVGHALNKLLEERLCRGTSGETRVAKFLRGKWTERKDLTPEQIAGAVGGSVENARRELEAEIALRKPFIEYNTIAECQPLNDEEDEFAATVLDPPGDCPFDDPAADAATEHVAQVETETDDPDDLDDADAAPSADAITRAAATQASLAGAEDSDDVATLHLDWDAYCQRRATAKAIGKKRKVEDAPLKSIGLPQYIEDLSGAFAKSARPKLVEWPDLHRLLWDPRHGYAVARQRRAEVPLTDVTTSGCLILSDERDFLTLRGMWLFDGRHHEADRHGGRCVEDHSHEIANKLEKRARCVTKARPMRKSVDPRPKVNVAGFSERTRRELAKLSEVTRSHGYFRKPSTPDHAPKSPLVRPPAPTPKPPSAPAPKPPSAANNNELIRQVA